MDPNVRIDCEITGFSIESRTSQAPEVLAGNAFEGGAAVIMLPSFDSAARERPGGASEVQSLLSFHQKGRVAKCNLTFEDQTS